jgi:hypothetical protein
LRLLEIGGDEIRRKRDVSSGSGRAITVANRG